MIMNIIIAIVILQIGTFLGIVISALMAAAKDSEYKKNIPVKSNGHVKWRNDIRKIWAIRDLCKWGGEIYEIRSFVERDGQTGACLLPPDADDAVTETIGGVLVPIEELEEVE